MLAYLAEQQLQSDNGKTPILSRAAISTATGINRESIDTSLRRLVAHDFLRRTEYSHAWNCGGSAYSLPKSILAQVMLHQSGDSRTNDCLDSRTTRRSSSSSDLITTTTTTARAAVADTASSEILDALITATTRFRLSAHQISANDLMQIWRSGVFTQLDDLLASAEHAGSYLGTEAAQGIKHPRAWFVSTLKKGPFAPPPDFVPWEVRAEMERLELATRRLQQLRQIRRARFDVEFEIWHAELTAEKRATLLKYLPAAQDSVAARAVLRAAFAHETGQIDILEAEDAEQP